MPDYSTPRIESKDAPGRESTVSDLCALSIGGGLESQSRVSSNGPRGKTGGGSGMNGDGLTGYEHLTWYFSGYTAHRLTLA